ncbi:MAG: hypothetical protein ACSLFC_11400 [Desulfuromonadales bacterium]
MKQILGIVASRRQLGNCEIMVKEVQTGYKDESPWIKPSGPQVNS